jgi:hypothetical protein
MKATHLLIAAAMVLGSGPLPVAAQIPGDGIAQPLTSCAGAIAAHADIDVVGFPAGAEGEWAPVLGAILEQLNRVDGLEGVTGRYAASAARSFWLERPRAERERAAAQCRDEYGDEDNG